MVHIKKKKKLKKKKLGKYWINWDKLVGDRPLARTQINMLSSDSDTGQGNKAGDVVTVKGRRRHFSVCFFPHIRLSKSPSHAGWHTALSRVPCAIQ